MRAKTADRYTDSVMAVLEAHFDDLTDPIVFEVVANAVRRQTLQPADHFEVILDMPSANWRLKRGLDGHGIRLSNYHLIDSPARDAKCAAVNAALDAIG